ncbi:MAG: hypothetical protein JSR77_18190 [Planctomycetes bacterium]|nr:hypothetical protein [Planctomycetota bacterium]
MIDSAPQPHRPPPATRLGLPIGAIGPLFVVVAVWLSFWSPKVEVPHAGVATVSRDRFLPGARRQPIGDPPATNVGGFSHACNECHRLFDSPPVSRRTLMQHTAIVLNHGMNNQCFNCHDRKNREKLVLHDGTLLPFSEVPRLCSQCHGTVFRDWQKGMHGKTMGSWNAASGKQHRLSCNDCHDPHAPAYQGIIPLPAPNTLRMGNQEPAAEQEHRHMPLRQWSLPEMPEPELMGPVQPGPEPTTPAKEDHQ